MSNYRYPWPASAIGSQEISMLHLARESSPSKTTITELLSQAVRAQYGHLANRPVISTEPAKKGSHYARTRIPEHDLEENPAARPAA